MQALQGENNIMFIYVKITNPFQGAYYCSQYKLTHGMHSVHEKYSWENSLRDT